MGNYIVGIVIGFMLGVCGGVYAAQEVTREAIKYGFFTQDGNLYTIKQSKPSAD